MLPKPLIRLGVNLLTRRTHAKLHARGTAIPSQEKTYKTLIAQLARGSFPRADGITPNLPYETFRATVPLRTYEGFTAPIEQMKRGAADVLLPGRCAHYAVSSGTTAGRTKYLPITDGMFRHFSRAGLDSLLYYTARTGHNRVFRGKHLFLGGATTLTPIAEAKPFDAVAGDLSGLTALKMPAWVDQHIYEPGQTIAQLSDWPEKLRAIAARTATRDITLVAGIPSWLLILAETLRTHTGKPADAPLNQIWPHLECCIHGGVPIAPFIDELRAAFGPQINFHEVYPASEGFIATQDADASAGLRLMTDVGLFYEFLPLRDYDESNLASLGPKAVPLSGVQPGIDYALVMTTPAGLYRYVIGDVVRFTSIEPPRLVYAGRTKLQLSAFGEHVIEKELTDALALICNQNNLTLSNFHVAPIFADTARGQTRGRHHWIIELKNETSPPAETLAAQLDAELIRLNDDYEAKRKGGGLEPPLITLVAAGTFEKWLRSKNKWGGQNKTPRCRSDREIADQLLGAL